MPNVNDLMQIAEALEKSPVAILRDRCVAVRNRNASCRRCIAACSAGAIEVAANEIRLDAGECTSCGACTAVCPTEALVPVAPLEADLASAAAEATLAAEGAAVFACARISSKRQADPRLYAEVPCLARLEESLLLALVSRGATDVLLVDGTCATCKYRGGIPCIDATVLYANELLAAQGSGVRVRRASAFPAALLTDTEGLHGSTRRGFFAEAAGAARDTAMTAAKATLAQELGLKTAEPEIGERLRVSADGSMPRLTMERHDALINAMDLIGAPVVDSMESRRFASISIDVPNCNACGMCAVFCPTGAIQRDSAEAASSPVRYLEFSAASCVQCGLCADVCWKGALTMSARVSTSQLFDFEPVTFDLSGARRPGKSLFR